VKNLFGLILVLLCQAMRLTEKEEADMGFHFRLFVLLV
jgi:hypothetical protein